MLGFFEKKSAPLFTLDLTLDGLSDDAASAKATTVKIKQDGSVYAGFRNIGTIAAPLWNYIRQFGTPKEMRRITPLVFEVDVPGTADREQICTNTAAHPYTYTCGSTCVWPRMIPKTEYNCDLVDRDDHLDVMVAGTKIGQMNEVEERKRLSKVRSMMKSGFQATAKIAPQNTYCDLYVNLRSNKQAR